MKSFFFRSLLICFVLVSSINSFSASSQPEQVVILGSGTPSLDTLMNFWSSNFYNASSGLVSVVFNTSSNEEGINDVKNFFVDFNGLDNPYSNFDKTETNATVLTIPITLNAVTIVVNFPDLIQPFIFDGDTLGLIFQRNITMWNDPVIASMNPAYTSLPNEEIKVVHRSDSSSTTKVFTKFLDYFDSWKLGIGNSIPWPTDTIGVSDNSGVADTIANTNYSIGYVDYHYYYLYNHLYNLKLGQIVNFGGNIVNPDFYTIASTANDLVPKLPPGDDYWDLFSLIPSFDNNSYPIVTYYYLTVYQHVDVGPADMDVRGPAFIAWLNYILSDTSQNDANTLGYTPLPPSVLSSARETIQTIGFDNYADPNDYWQNTIATTGTITFTDKTTFPTIPTGTISPTTSPVSSSSSSLSNSSFPFIEEIVQDAFLIILSVGAGSGAGLVLALIFRRFRS